jgi:hypothetical protein
MLRFPAIFMEALMAESRAKATSPFKMGQPFVSEGLDLVQVLKDERGTFEVNYNGNCFIVTCEPEHSISSFIPNGIKNIWLITRKEVLPVDSEEEHRRGAASGT